MPGLKVLIFANAKQAKQEVSDLKHIFREMGKDISSELGSKLARLATVGFLEESIRRTMEYAHEVSELSNRLGISTDAVQAWDYALKMSGSSIESAAGFFEKLATSRKKALEGNDDAVQSYKRLGVTLDDLRNLRLEDVGEKIARAFQGGDPQALIADLREVGGRSAGELVGAFREGLADAAQEARDGGIIISNAVIESLADAVGKSKQMWMQFVSGIAPAIAWLAQRLSELWRGWNALARGAAGFVYGGKEGAQAAVAEYAEELRKQDEAEARRREARNKPFAGGVDYEDKEAAKEQDRDAKKQQELEDQLQKAQEKNYLKSLSRDERLAELRRRKEDAEAMANDPTLGRTFNLQSAIRAQDYAAQIAEAEKEKQKYIHGNVNTLQQIGAYTAPASLAMIDIAKKSERHLAEINQNIKTLGVLGGRHANTSRVHF